MVIRDLYMKFIDPDLDDRKIIYYTRASNVIICVISMGIALFQISIVTLNLFAFALRSAGPFAAYGLGLVVPKASRHSGLVSIIVGSIAVVYWQLANPNHPVLPIVFGCLMGSIAFLSRPSSRKITSHLLPTTTISSIHLEKAAFGLLFFRRIRIEPAGSRALDSVGSTKSGI